MLRRIIELVDKDVAANPKPISMIGAVIPFLPFMMFVEGAPIDTYPVLGGFAFAASITWLLFVFWRMFRHSKTQFENYGYVIGSFRFWRLIIGTLLLIALITVLIMWIRGQLG